MRPRHKASTDRSRTGGDGFMRATGVTGDMRVAGARNGRDGFSRRARGKP